MLHQLRKMAPIAWMAAGALVGGGVALASIPDSGGVIHGCYDARGKLRVIDAEAGETCRTHEVALSWNETGPQGPQGLEGPEGPAGTAVTARVRLAAPVTLNTEDFFNLPLDSSTWVQEADALNTLYLRARATGVDTIDPGCNPTANLDVDVFVDGALVNSMGASAGRTIAFSVPQGASRAVEFGPPIFSIHGNDVFSHVLFEPGADTAHTLTAQARTSCEGLVVNELSVDVVAVG